MKTLPIPILFLIFQLFIGNLIGQEQTNDQAIYIPKEYEKILKDMEDKNEQVNVEKQNVTEKIRQSQEVFADSMNSQKKELRVNFESIQKPQSIEEFNRVFHFKPVRQYNTWACWSFSTTSFFESEIYRIHGEKIKLSEMYTVYYDYLEKARRFVEERGNSFFDGGSEGNAVMMIWKKYGIVPSSEYLGVLNSDSNYDTSEMKEKMKSYLQYIRENEIWDEDLVVSSIKLIMEEYLGKPPIYFNYNGKNITPLEFLKEIVRLNLDDYVSVMSTLAEPFYEYGEYAVEGNWWHSKEYYNLPLKQFYDVILYAAKNNHSVKLNGDVSEPGYYGKEDSAIIPTFDIQNEYINQSSREFRFNNGTTFDDHDIHLVGYTTIGDYDWYLIKDSGSPSYMGKHYGYLFYREDYIKLKMLTYIVHKDVLKSVVKQFTIKN